MSEPGPAHTKDEGRHGSRPSADKVEGPAPSGPVSVSDVSNDMRAVRLLRLQELRAQGVEPFRANWEQAHTSAQALKLFVDGQETGPEVSVAGRLMVFRDMGKSCFIKLLGRDGLIQVYVKKDEVGEKEYAEFKKLDLGDILGVSGPLFKTKTGEVTVRAQKYALVAKALRPLPEKWHGLTDSEQIYRQRYLDLVVEATGDVDWFKRTREEKLAACTKLGLEVNPALPNFEITQDVFELIVNGHELAPAYSEQNDPLAQREQLMKQAGQETQKLDEDFLTALEHGMPPAGGLGMGVDRLIILLTGAANIRDAILFPSLRNAESANPKAE